MGTDVGRSCPKIYTALENMVVHIWLKTDMESVGCPVNQAAEKYKGLVMTQLLLNLIEKNMG